jgi:hypothetical protein
MRRTLFGIVMLIALPLLAAERKGFVWASDPAAASYTANASYAYNSAGGAITIRRTAAGQYAVTFAGLAKGARSASNVQVTAYGPGSESCGVVGWSGSEDLVVSVRCIASASGQPADARFTVLATWAPEVLQLKQVLPAVVSAKPPADAEPKRTINEKGHVVITYPDGRVVERFFGGSDITFPDGTVQSLRFNTAAPVAAPPTAPPASEVAWLNAHAERLLEVMETIVGGDHGVVTRYVATEPATLTIYERISKRRDTIGYLLQ